MELERGTQRLLQNVTVQVSEAIVIGGETQVLVTDQLYTSGQPNIQGGLKPFRFVLHSGTLPAGLELNEATGVVSGRPEQVQSGLRPFSDSLLIVHCL